MGHGLGKEDVGQLSTKNERGTSELVAWRFERSAQAIFQVGRNDFCRDRIPVIRNDPAIEKHCLVPQVTGTSLSLFDSSRYPEGAQKD